jgi:hypothetical protein
MSDEPQKGTKVQLALAVARGDAIRNWARDNNVPRRTAFRWAKEPDVRKAVESYRRRMIDQAIGRMTRRSGWVADGITQIAREARSDSVRLRAYRAMFSDMMAVNKFSGLESRMVEVEEQLAAYQAYEREIGVVRQ